MRIVEKAVAAVVRVGATGEELLVFTHPFSGVQIPKGTIEPDEPIVAAALRELEEESGLRLPATPRHIGTWQRQIIGPGKDGTITEIHPWHVCLIETSQPLPEAWTHIATGSPDEEGLAFAYHWLTIDMSLADRLHPLFAQVIAMLRAHLNDR